MHYGMWTPHPRDIVWFPDQGRADFGTIEEPTSRVGRYALGRDEYFVLAGLQARFGDTIDADAPAGGATLTLYNHSKYAPNLAGLGASSTELVHGVYWLQEWADCGVTRNRINFHAAPQRFWGDLIFEPGDTALLTWTNPESDGTLSWTWRVGLAKVPPMVAARTLAEATALAENPGAAGVR